MTIKDMLQNFRNKNFEPKGEDYDDNMTRDAYLRSLRRQRRIQLEELEKANLKKEIAEFEKEKARRNMWGITDKKEKVDLMRVKKMKMLGKM